MSLIQGLAQFVAGEIKKIKNSNYAMLPVGFSENFSRLWTKRLAKARSSLRVSRSMLPQKIKKKNSTINRAILLCFPCSNISDI